jgi:hypothetical protein
MGKGLGLKPHGTHIAFAAGTGILVFIDFLALMLRANLGLVPTADYPIFQKTSTFRLILYVSFDNRREALALELMQGLYEVTHSLGLSNFDLVIRISSEKAGSRWD